MKSEVTIEDDHERACAQVAARFRPRWLRSYVAGKLRTDPVYQATYKLLHTTDQPVLDVGCGVGLFAFYLRERQFLHRVLGIDSDTRKIQRARAVAAPTYHDVQFSDGDVRQHFAFSGNVVLFDVLHYLQPADQRDLLLHLADCVKPGGLLIIRDCPRDHTMRFRMTYLAERFAQMISWNLAAPLHFPSRENIESIFAEKGFTASVEPLWGGTPFNNHLFVFRNSAATDRAPE